MLHTSVHICQLKRTHSSGAWEAVTVILTENKSIQNFRNLHSLTGWNKDTHCASFHCKWYFVLFHDYSAYQKGRMCPSLSIFLICIRSAMVIRWSFEADMWSTVSGKVALNVTRMTSSNYLKFQFTCATYVGNCRCTTSPPPPLLQSAVSWSWINWAAASEHL